MSLKVGFALVLVLFSNSACGSVPGGPSAATTTPLHTQAVPSSTSTSTPSPTITPSPSETKRPTLIPTHAPASTSASGSDFLLPLPQKVPVNVWHGIRIMPGALKGEETPGGAYAFTTMASPQSIEKFYMAEMQAKGWTYIATGTTQKGGLLIVFDRGASVAVIPIGDDQDTKYVMIVLGG
jgi:hypothetical protein